MVGFSASDKIEIIFSKSQRLSCLLFWLHKVHLTLILLIQEIKKAMGKASKWLRNLLIGKRIKEEKEKSGHEQTLTKTKSLPAPVMAPKEKRWSFRRAVTTGNNSNSQVCVNPGQEGLSESHVKQRTEDVAEDITKIAAGDAAVAMTQSVAATVRLNSTAIRDTTRDIEETAAIKIQSIFRSHLVIFSSSLS